MTPLGGARIGAIPPLAGVRWGWAGGDQESFGLPGMIGGGSGLRSRRVGSASAANRDRTQSMSASRQAAPSRGGVSFGSAPRLSSTSTAPAPPRRRPRRAATSRCRCAGSTPRRGRSGAVPPRAGWRGRRWPTSDRRRSPADAVVHPLMRFVRVVATADDRAPFRQDHRGHQRRRVACLAKLGAYSTARGAVAGSERAFVDDSGPACGRVGCWWGAVTDWLWRL